MSKNKKKVATVAKTAEQVAKVDTPKKQVKPAPVKDAPKKPTVVTKAEEATIMSAADIVNKGVDNIPLDTIATVTKNLTDRYINHPVECQEQVLIESMVGAGGIIDMFNVECVARILASGKMITLSNIKNSASYEQFQKVCGYFGVTLPTQKSIAANPEGTLQFKDGENGVEVSDDTKETIAEEETRDKKDKKDLTVETATDENIDLALQRVWNKEKVVSLGNGLIKTIEFIQTYDHNHAENDTERDAVDNRTVTDIINRIYSVIPGGMLLFDALGKMLISLIKNDRNPITAFLQFKAQIKLLDDINSVKDDSGEYVKKVYVYPFKDKEIAQLIIALVDHTLTGINDSMDRMIAKAEEVNGKDKETRIKALNNLKNSYGDVYDSMTLMKESDINNMKDNRDEIAKVKDNAEKKAELEKSCKTLFVVAGNYGLSVKDEKTKKTIIKDVDAVKDISKYIANLFRAVDCQMPTDYIITASVKEAKN